MKTVMTFVLLLTATAHAAQLRQAKALYNAITNIFPDSVEHVGGLSTEITMGQLICAKSRIATGTDFSCAAYNRSGDDNNRNQKTAKALYTAMLKSGAKLDTTSEPGTEYVILTNLDCFREECKSSRPSDCRNVPVKYTCTAE